ncbi:MAG: Phage Mu protein F like protein domain protein [bacterium F082]|nr:MAG: Phage Mu protein F like protein domain protein [bacterium F082]KWW29173.1 MAG: Phage Mu protein F like protein domain protein [bacterium P201]
MLSEPEPLTLITATHDALAEELGRLERSIPDEMARALDENIFLFSGFKTYHEMNDASRLLKDEDGGFKSFDRFLQDVQAIDASYNQNWLYAEYNFATASTQMAAKWADIERDGDEYDLQYRTALDGLVRPEHAALEGITLPPSDKFWNEYYPPNGWNCRCTAVQVLKDKYPTSDSDQACAAGERATTQIGKNGQNKAEMFRFNPGKAGKVFPPKHPYFKAPAGAKKAVGKAATTAASTPNNPYQLKAKTVAEAEKEIAQNLGVTCNFKGFTKNDLQQIQDIYSSVATHLDKYPDLKKHINFVGSMQGRKALFYDKFYQELKTKYPTFPDATIQRTARSYANSYASIPSNAYAYSAPSTKFDLNGVAFNANYKGDKVKKTLDSDLKAKWHPEGCNTVKSVFDHELGHKIDETLGLRSDAEFLKIFTDAEQQGKAYIKDNLSEYAYMQSKTTPDYNPKAEFIAEAWSEYLNNPNPRPIAKSVGDLIVKKTKWKK